MGGVVLGAVLGVLAGYAYSESKSAQRRVAKIKKAVQESGVRLPRPDFRVHLPNSAQDYDILDEVICECAAQAQVAQLDTDSEEFLVSVRDCVLESLYPDFEWPPVPGDHPSVEHLWTIISYEVGRSASEGTLCVQDTEEEDTEESPLSVKFLSPPR